jgi:hypothetical protein
MRFFAAVDALPSLESMKFPVFSLLTGNFGLFRDEFAADSSGESMRTYSALMGLILNRICVRPRKPSRTR